MKIEMIFDFHLFINLSIGCLMVTTEKTQAVLKLYFLNNYSIFYYVYLFNIVVYLLYIYNSVFYLITVLYFDKIFHIPKLCV